MVTFERFKEIVKGITDNTPGNEPKIRRRTLCTSRIFNEVMRKIRRKTGVER